MLLRGEGRFRSVFSSVSSGKGQPRPPRDGVERIDELPDRTGSGVGRVPADRHVVHEPGLRRAEGVALSREVPPPPPFSGRRQGPTTWPVPVERNGKERVRVSCWNDRRCPGHLCRLPWPAPRDGGREPRRRRATSPSREWQPVPGRVAPGNWGRHRPG